MNRRRFGLFLFAFCLVAGFWDMYVQNYAFATVQFFIAYIVGRDL